MIENPLVSIVIPCYNYAHLLPDSLNSILRQTYSDWECLVIDDGSTDNTEEVVLSFSEKDVRIKYFYQSNSGPSKARNRGINLSKGEFIQFLDADDLLENRKLEVQSSILKDNTIYDIVYSGMNYFSSGDPTLLFNNSLLNKDNNRSWMKKVSGSGDLLIRCLLRENIMVINSPLVRKSVFEKTGYFDEQLKYNEDWELWTRCAINNIVFLFNDAPDTNALVRIHSSSYSAERFKMYVYGLKVCLQINRSLEHWKYKKIIALKIWYHQNILEKKIIACYQKDKNKAVEMLNLLIMETEHPRYRRYKWLFANWPYPLCYVYSKILYVLNIFKRIIVYAS